MNYFSYVIEHDYGLAPNPFGEYCTLAVCKPGIRKNKNLMIGDWIIGTASKKLEKINHLIYAMQLEEKLTFDQYWNDPRFQHKKPIINGSLVQMYGDNFYHRDIHTNEWIQERSAHSTVDIKKHIKKDTSADCILLSKNFYYLGNNAVLIPDDCINICKKGPGMKYKDLEDEGDLLVKWLQSNFKKGINGDPINWKEYNNVHNQTTLQL